jgi:hypothetical protein
MRSSKLHTIENLVENWCDEITKGHFIACCVVKRSDAPQSGVGVTKARLFAVGTKSSFDVTTGLAEFIDRYENGTLREYVETLIVQGIISGEIVK